MDEKLAGLLSDIFKLPVAEITLSTSKDDVGSWDSLRQMDLVTGIEREYSIALDIPDIIRMTSVGEIVSVLQEKGVQLEAV